MLTKVHSTSRMNTRKDQLRMSFSLCPSVCEVILKGKRPAPKISEQVRMHSQSEGGSVLRLHSCRALSPAPLQQCAGHRNDCQLKN